MININEILEKLPHRYPFLLVDRVIEVNSGEFAKSIKCVTFNEPFFNGHFPNNPIMPGVLIVEALAQNAALAVANNIDSSNKKVFFMAIDKCKFRKPVIPGDVLNLECRKLQNVKNVYKFEGKAFVNNVIVAECVLTAMITDE